MSLARVLLPTLPVAFSLLGACDGLLTGSGCGVGDCLLSTRVTGQVTDPSGVPVSGAAVRLRPLFRGLGHESCIRAPLLEEGELDVLVESGGSGEFSSILEAPSIDRPNCVELRVEPPSGVSLQSRTDTIRASWVPPARSVPTSYVALVLPRQ